MSRKLQQKNPQIQVVVLSPEDRKVLSETAKWIKRFAISYIVMWTILTVIMFFLIWIRFRR